MKMSTSVSKDIYINILRTEEEPLSVRLFGVLADQNPAFCVKYAIRCCELIEHELPPYSKHALSILKDFENRTREELEAAFLLAKKASDYGGRYDARAVLSAVRTALFFIAGDGPDTSNTACIVATRVAWYGTLEQEIVSLLIDML